MHLLGHLRRIDSHGLLKNPHSTERFPVLYLVSHPVMGETAFAITLDSVRMQRYYFSTSPDLVFTGAMIHLTLKPLSNKKRTLSDLFLLMLYGCDALSAIVLKRPSFRALPFRGFDTSVGRIIVLAIPIVAAYCSISKKGNTAPQVWWRTLV